MASNRKVTKSQFSAGTTIDGADIDATVDEFVEYHNEVPRGFTDGRLTPVNYVAHWSPTKPHFTNSREPGAVATFTDRNRHVPVNYTSWTEHNFPFLVCRNWVDETYPLSVTVPDPPTLNNEYRHKGFASNSDLDLHEIWTRGTPVADGMPTYVANDPAVPNSMDIIPDTNGFGSLSKRVNIGTFQIPVYHPMNQKYLAATFSYYFDKPVVLSSLNVVAASEHPISYFGSGLDLVDPANPFFNMDTVNNLDYKAPHATVNRSAVQYDDPPMRTTIPTKFIEDCTDGTTNNIGHTGNVFPGADSMGLGGSISTEGNFYPKVQLSIDNEFNTEKRELNNLAVNIREMGHNASAYKFNRLHPTSRRSGPATVGANYTDMEPAYPGGATWGVFITEQNLNIPIPAGSRVRFSIIIQGFNAAHAFEWNSNLTVLEEVED